MATVNSVGLLAAEIRMPRIGTWHADIEAESEADFSAGVAIEIDGIEFIGTALHGRSGVNGSRAIARVVGGAGGLSTVLQARSYVSDAGVRVSAILGDVLRETGETLSATVEAAILDRRLPRWHRDKGRASHALVHLADAIGASWRILIDGTLWIGVETWPEVDLEHVLEDEDWAAGAFTIAPSAPSLTPGVTFLEHQIEAVVHTVDREGMLRTRTEISSLRSAFSRVLGRIRRDIDFSRVYRCRVVSQNADYTLQLEPDDARMKARGLDKVPIWPGLPGVRVEVPKGAIVLLGFLGGDPSLPYAACWAGETEVTRVTFAGGTSDVTGAGHMVDVYFPEACPIEGELGGSPFVGFITLLTPGVGVIAEGNSKLLI